MRQSKLEEQTKPRGVPPGECQAPPTGSWTDREVFPEALGEASEYDQLEPVFARPCDVDTDVVEQSRRRTTGGKGHGREIDRAALGKKETASGAEYC